MSIRGSVREKRWKFFVNELLLSWDDEIEEIYRRLEPRYGDGFGIEEIMALLREEPTLLEINRACEEKPTR